MYLCFKLYMRVYHVWAAASGGQKEGVKSPGAGLTGSYELPIVGAGD